MLIVIVIVRNTVATERWFVTTLGLQGYIVDLFEANEPYRHAAFMATQPGRFRGLNVVFPPALSRFLFSAADRGVLRSFRPKPNSKTPSFL